MGGREATAFERWQLNQLVRAREAGGGHGWPGAFGRREVNVGGREVRVFGWELNQLARGHSGGGRWAWAAGRSGHYGRWELDQLVRGH